MKIRAIHANDLEQIRRIHAKHYSDEFGSIDFSDKFLCAFVVEEEEKIITAGGVRTLLEAVAITDKDVSVRKRREALLMMMRSSLTIADINNYDGVHAFIQDPLWKQHLINQGFRSTKGDTLIIEV